MIFNSNLRSTSQFNFMGKCISRRMNFLKRNHEKVDLKNKLEPLKISWAITEEEVSFNILNETLKILGVHLSNIATKYMGAI